MLLCPKLLAVYETDTRVIWISRFSRGSVTTLVDVYGIHKYTKEKRMTFVKRPLQ